MITKARAIKEAKSLKNSGGSFMASDLHRKMRRVSPMKPNIEMNSSRKIGGAGLGSFIQRSESATLTSRNQSKGLCGAAAARKAIIVTGQSCLAGRSVFSGGTACK